MYLKSMQPLSVSSIGYLEVIASTTELLIVKILDIRGHIAKTIIERIEHGNQRLSLNFCELKSGSYVLNAFCGETFLKAIRFVKN